MKMKFPVFPMVSLPKTPFALSHLNLNGNRHRGAIENTRFTGPSLLSSSLSRGLQEDAHTGKG